MTDVKNADICNHIQYQKKYETNLPKATDAVSCSIAFVLQIETF